MKKKPYLPTREPERVIWLNNFASVLASYNTQFGISAAELGIVVAMAAIYTWIIGIIYSAKKFKEDMNKYKNKLSRDAVSLQMNAPTAWPGSAAPAATLSGIFNYVGKLVARIKANTSYDENIGEELGIIGDETEFDPATAQTELKLKFTGNHVQVSFTNPEEVDAVRIMSKRGTETVTTALGDDAHSPYVDTRPNLVQGTAETRVYEGWYIQDGHVIGVVSLPVSISVNPAP